MINGTVPDYLSSLVLSGTIMPVHGRLLPSAFRLKIRSQLHKVRVKPCLLAPSINSAHCLQHLRNVQVLSDFGFLSYGAVHILTGYVWMMLWRTEKVPRVVKEPDSASSKRNSCPYAGGCKIKVRGVLD